MVNTIVAKEKLDCTHLLGQFLDESHYDTVIDSDTDFYIPSNSINADLDENRVGFIFRNGYFDLDQMIGAYEGMNEVADVASNNRGLAAGPKVEKVGNRDWLTACQYEILEVFKKAKQPLPGFDPIQEILDKYAGGDIETTRGCMWLYHATRKDKFDWTEWFTRTRTLSLEERKREALFVEDKYISISTYASPVNSGVAGAMDRYPRYPFARHCAYNRDHPEKFSKAFPYLQRLSNGFKEFLPNRWANQAEACAKIDDRFVVPGTVFTTITVNKTFRTGAHMDAGDLEAGFSNLAVITDGKSDFTGGYLVLPEYRAAIKIRPGDLLLVANHNIIHGNTPISGHRVSIVAYFREGLIGTGSFEYERCRFDYVESRKKDRSLPQWKPLFNGVTAGMWDEEAWYNFLEKNLGASVLLQYHPQAKPEKAATLF